MAVMKKFYIGDLIPESTKKTQKQIDFEKGYRDLRSKLIMMGMFKSSKLFYAYKCSFNMCIGQQLWVWLLTVMLWRFIFPLLFFWVFSGSNAVGLPMISFIT